MGSRRLPDGERRRLILEMEPVARRLAARFRRSLPPGALTHEDLEQQAVLGICQAAERWDPDGGASWPAFAYRRAFGAIQDQLRASGLGGRNHWRDVTVAALEDAGEAIPSPDPPLEEAVDGALLPARLEHAVVEELTIDEQSIVAMRLDGLGREDMARAFGVSTTRISQMTRTAFDKLARRPELRDDLP